MANAALKGVEQVRKAREQEREKMKRAVKVAADALERQRQVTANVEEELRTAMASLQSFEKEFPATTETAPAAPESQTRVGKGKRGPAKKVAAKTASKPAAKTAPKKQAAAKTAAKPGPKKPGPKKGANKAALKGREEVSSGKRPPIKHAICRVLGDKEMGAQEIFDKVKEKGWLPSSNNPRAYIGNILSAQKDVFPPVQRGVYRRADNWEELLGPENRGGKKATAAKSAPAAKAAKGGGNGHKAAEKTEKAEKAETKAASTETVAAPAEVKPAEPVKKDILEEAKDIFAPNAATA